MTTANITWTVPINLPDEHRIFRVGKPLHHSAEAIVGVPSKLVLDERGLWAIADNSGDYPEITDDGILWLDFRRHLMAGSPARDDRPGNSPGIPLLAPDGAEQRAVCDTSTLLVLSSRFNWNINCLGTIYRVVKF
jgi:hypothetical protein